MVGTKPKTVHRFRSQATDGAGNTSAFANAPPFEVTVVQDGSRSIKAKGTWAVKKTRSAFGGSVRQAMAINFVLAAFAGGAGGALTVMSLGHIDPNFSFWTTSGEFVFVAILMLGLAYVWKHGDLEWIRRAKQDLAARRERRS